VLPIPPLEGEEATRRGEGEGGICEEMNSYPSEEEPSDHVMIGAEVELLSDTTSPLRESSLTKSVNNS
jgi:hypothetical protein